MKMEYYILITSKKNKYMQDKEIKGIVVNDEYNCSLSLSDIVGTLTSPNGTKFTLKVDNEGHLYADDGGSEEPVEPLAPPTTAALCTFGGESKFYINEIYCGGEDSDENSLNYCSHNFVELANLTKVDINLHGMSLQYAISDRDWAVLPLEGVIRSGSTFLIRGAQCSDINSPTTKIKVNTYDLEWKRNVNGSEELIKFESKISAKFYLVFNLNAYPNPSPYNTTDKKVSSDAIGYIDLVGIQGTGLPEGNEVSPYSNGKLSNKFLYRKYYAMDPVSQATKAIGKRNNANDWCYVDLTKDDGEVIPNIEVYTPKASFEKKNIFYNKTGLSSAKPSVITCSFGIRATDDGIHGATRCFNWVSGNMSDKYIWIRAKGSQSWGTGMESFNEDDGRVDYTLSFYNRSIKLYTNNTYLVVNKYIKSGLTAGDYEYVAGAKKSDGTPDFERCTEIRSFKVRTTQSVIENGFTFVQTSDQQGFNWEEYEVWAATARLIDREDAQREIHFMVNTGDMTQNGNRLGEWLDYFNAKGDYFNNMEEMATIGNNDLSMNPLYLMGDGGDGSKLWLENINLFYTFEADASNPPIFNTPNGSQFMPSLYYFVYGDTLFISLNSEIKASAETSKNAYGFSNNGVFYPQIKDWCTAVIENSSLYNINWKIMFCHEMPFTIQIAAKVQDRMTATGNLDKRIENGSGCSACANISSDKVYWVSEFCQRNGIKLVIGGHKHTQATTYPIIENIKYGDNDERFVDSFHPIIPVTSGQTGTLYQNWEGATSLVIMPETGYKYPNSWFLNDNPEAPKSDSVRRMMGMCTFEYEENIESGIVPVTYAMSQATGYKHTSNKELPSPDIAWLQYYFPADVNWADDKSVSEPKVNAHQKFPFYTIWKLSSNKIEGHVRKAYGIFNSGGNFDINIEGPFVKKNVNVLRKNELIKSINGITSLEDDVAEIDQRIIEVEK